MTKRTVGWATALVTLICSGCIAPSGDATDESASTEHGAQSEHATETTAVESVPGAKDVVPAVSCETCDERYPCTQTNAYERCLCAEAKAACLLACGCAVPPRCIPEPI